MAKTNAQRQKEYRERNKKTSVTGVGDNTPGDVVPTGAVASSGGGDDLEVEVKDEGVQPFSRPSLKDRILQKLQGASDAQPVPQPIKRRGKKKKGGDNLLVTLAPTVVGSFVATYSQQLLPEEYQPCAPTSEEVTGILAPLLEVIGRRVEVVGEASEDMLAVCNSIICTLMYGARAYITYTDIKNAQEGHSHARQTPLSKANSYARSIERETSIYDDALIDDIGSSPLAGGLRSYQAAAQGYSRNGTGGVGGATYAHDTESDVGRNGADAASDTGQSGSSEADKVANLFRRDVTGRQQLGLLPRRV